MRLSSDRLILRQFELDDEEAVHWYASDPEVVRYTDWGPNTPEQTAARIRAYLDGTSEDETDFAWAITRRNDGRVIGSAGLWVESRQHLRAEFGYVLARDVWGHGYATETARLLLNYAFG